MDHAMVGTVFSVVQTRPGACAPAPSIWVDCAAKSRADVKESTSSSL